VVTNTFRIANRVDLVPNLPPTPPYEHVLGVFGLNQIRILPLPPKILVKPDPVCSHILTSYLHLLSLSAGGAVLDLDKNCVV